MSASRVCFSFRTPAVRGAVLAVALLTGASARARAAQQGIVIDSGGVANPDQDPAEQGEAGQADQATDAEQAALRIPCLEDLSPDGDFRKGVQKRDFLKKNRFELSAIGGLYASDVMSSTYTAGAAAAFYPGEDFGVELLVTRANVAFGLEEPFSAFDQKKRFSEGQAFQAVASLLYAPFHAKFKFTEASIVSGDIFVVGGAGRTFHGSVQGLTWEGGVGMKLYLWKFISFRIDIRDYVVPQEVLGRGRITNNLAVTGGFSFWVL